MYDTSRNAGRLTFHHKVFGTLTPGPAGHVLFEFRCGKPASHCVELRVRGPRRVTHHLPQCTPLSIVHTRDGHPAFVGRLGRLIVTTVATVRRGIVVRQCIAGRSCGTPVGRKVKQRGPEQVHCEFELRQVNPLATPRMTAGLKGRQNGNRAMQSGLMIVIGEADTNILATRNPC